MEERGEGQCTQIANTADCGDGLVTSKHRAEVKDLLGGYIFVWLVFTPPVILRYEIFNVII